MSGKAKTAQKAARGLLCTSHGRGLGCEVEHPARPTAIMLEFRRNAKGNLAPRRRKVQV